ncbi:hypothetical protein SeMB42_g04796 [Synchytrium endobioticum]|uniref:Uncharacterized protein n=1 Tax=Synchytrium endobioticum TaxID=286115 RepID=A0A507CVN8_9FUNG|nr:hypothetical protein SeMB42_g04796 [Synchytrium endobioticum]
MGDTSATPPDVDEAPVLYSRVFRLLLGPPRDVPPSSAFRFKAVFLSLEGGFRNVNVSPLLRAHLMYLGCNSVLCIGLEVDTIFLYRYIRERTHISPQLVPRNK